MVQMALDMVATVLRALGTLWLPLLVLLGVLALALLLLALLDRARVPAALTWLGARLPRAGGWALALLALGVGVLALVVVRQAVDLRLSSALSARYGDAADPDASPTVQPAPLATRLEARTYTRTLTLPPALLQRVGDEGVQVLAPYLQDPSAEGVIRLRDRFTRSGQNVVFTREATLASEVFVPLTSSTVRATLVGAAGRSGRDRYEASFGGEYTFANSAASPATLRFDFPLPQGSGTLSGFVMTVNGAPLALGDVSEGARWEGVVPAGGTVRVAVRYRHQGARGWSYSVSRQREPVRRFDLTLTSDRDARFARYSLYPTQVSGGRFGQPQTLRWTLTNAITAQNVAVVFAQGSLRETLAKLHAAAPLALTLGALLLLLYAAAWLPRLSPLRLGLALLSLALGWALGGVLTAYLAAGLAEPAGALVGFALAVAALGRRFAAPLGLVALAPLCFLWAGNAGLLLGLLSLAAALLLLRRLRGPGRTA